jgi:amino acid transporter
LGDQEPAVLERHLGLLQATAINVTMVVGAGVFIIIPDMLGVLPGPYALLGWLAAGALILVDCLVWSELGAALPGSGGSYIYLLECYGRNRWGRLMAFLFIWQFLLSGPLEIASGLIAADSLAQGLSEDLSKFNDEHKQEFVLNWQDFSKKDQKLTVTFSPTRGACLAVGAFCIALLYRRVTSLGKLAVVFWIGILGAVGWILFEGIRNFDASRAFDFSGAAVRPPADLSTAIGVGMMLALYSYIGYYNICYMGDEVHNPGRNIPRSILLSTGLVIILFVGLHLAMLGTVSWQEVVTKARGPDGLQTLGARTAALAGMPGGAGPMVAVTTFAANIDDTPVNLPAAFMTRARGDWAAKLVILLILGSIFASAFSGLLGYSRIPFGAARAGHFFAAVGRVHPRHNIPHISLLLVGGLTLFWTLFDFGSVLNALITTRLLVQFVAQIAGLAVLRRARPHGPWPFRMWLYPLPSALALAGWLYVFATSGLFFIVVSLATMLAGLVTFFIWSAIVGSWPFGAVQEA